MPRQSRQQIIAAASQTTRARLAAMRGGRELRDSDLIDVAIQATYDTIFDANYGDGVFPDAADTMPSAT